MTEQSSSKNSRHRRDQAAVEAGAIIRRLQSNNASDVDEMRELLTDLVEEQTWKKEFFPEPATTDQVEAQTPSTPPHLLPDWEVTIDAMLQWIEPGVHDLRSELFGDPQPPFQTREQAVAWISEHSASCEQLPASKQKEWQELQRDLMRLVAEMDRVTGIPRRLNFTEVTLEYIPPGDDMATLATASYGSPIIKLASFAGWASRNTLFREASIVNYVLVGETPQLERVEVPAKAPGPPSRTQITINAQNVCKDDLIFAWKRYSYGRTKANLIDRVDQDIWNAVRELEGPPEAETNEEFWRVVKKRVEEKGNIEYENWRGPMMRWRRLMKNHPWLWKALEWGV